jgi:hypothetical protein
MKRLLALVLVLCAPLAGADDSPFSSRAIVAYRLALTDLGRFGAPRYTTSLLPACTTGNRGAIAFDTTAGALKTCSGASWASGGLSFGGSSGGTATRVPFTDGSGNLTDDADLTFSIDTLTATKIGSTTFTGTNTSTGSHEFFGKTNISGPGSGTNVEIGSTSNDANAGTGGTSIVIGNNAINTDSAGGVLIGHNAVMLSGSTSSIAIGKSAGVQASQCTLVGSDSNCSATFGTYVGNNINSASSARTYAFGYGLSVGGLSDIIQIGMAGGTTVANSATITTGSSGNGILNVYFGKGYSSTAALNYAINGTAGSGTDNAGGGVTLAGGKGTGTARGGNVQIQTSPSIATGTTVQTLETRGLVVARQFTLVDNTVATFATLILGNDTGGGGTIHYCVRASDATNEQLECGAIDFGGVDITAGAGGETCPAPTKIGTPFQALSSGTLTTTFSATTGTDLCNLRITADTSLTPTSLSIKYSVTHNNGQTITPQ